MGLFYRTTDKDAVDPSAVVHTIEAALGRDKVVDAFQLRSERDDLMASNDLGHLLAAVEKGKDAKGKNSGRISHVPSNWVLFWASVALLALYLLGYFLEPHADHKKASDVAFASFQLLFPGLLGLLGIETAKHG